MSHAYHLRPNAKGRMQRRLNAHVAAYGEQNRDKITAVPSQTGQGVHLHFDPERSLSPAPDQETTTTTTDRPCADSTEGVVVIDDDSESGEDSSSGLGSDLDTIAPDTPSPRRQFWPSSQLRAPKASRHAKQEHWREGSVDSSSVPDTMAPIVERRQALNSHLNGDIQGRRHHLLEQHRRAGEDLQRQEMMLHHHQAGASSENGEQRIAALRQDYESRVEQFRRENAAIFGFEEGVEYSDYFSEHGDPLPQRAGPSRTLRQRMHRQNRTLRRHDAEQFIVPPKQEQRDGAAADGQFVVVARRVPKLGPCGTVVIDHTTGEEISVTRRYRVRAEELRSIDGDGDSVMGSDD